MTRATMLAIAALPAALLLGASHAFAARPLLAELLARAPVNTGEPAKMSPLALEACLRTARVLDATGTAIDYEIAAIDRETAEPSSWKIGSTPKYRCSAVMTSPASTPSRSD